ncbi:cytochrome c [Shimia sp.]|uniref:c-type cytochrome n=1 Tax=Shimia sp. TaxID=1954381 RepID=UPI0025D5F7F5|nr:cytochrome c [Shimia sp.]
MHYKMGVIVACLLLLGGAIWSLFGAPSEALRLHYDDAQSVSRGEMLYADNCASCHGADLQGEPNWRQPDADGRMPAPPHDESGHTWHHPDEALFRLTKLGTAAVVGQGYESNMLGFSETLSDQDILDVLGYIKSTWPPEIIEMHNGMTANTN